VSAEHDHTHELTGGRLRLAFLLTLVILATELTAGLVSHSLALLSDAGHILTDAIALGLAWFAVAQGRRPADSRRTYGYQRVGILTALVNGATLIVIVAAIAVEAVQRLRHPEPVQGAVVIAAALVAIAVNGFIGLSLRGAGGDLNVRAALLHVVGDLAASVGVVAAGAVVLLTGWLPADPLLSLGIAALIAFGAWGVVQRTVHILLEGTPTGLDVAAVRAEMEAYEGVRSVHDLHVWC
jgi:cobalt-zinc-cadmium efflux system protein